MGSGLYIWHLWTSNSRAIDTSASEVTAEVNTALQARRLEPISTVEFPKASRMLGVPKTLEFQESVYERNSSAPGLIPERSKGRSIARRVLWRSVSSGVTTEGRNRSCEGSSLPSLSLNRVSPFAPRKRCSFAERKAMLITRRR